MIEFRRATERARVSAFFIFVCAVASACEGRVATSGNGDDGSHPYADPSLANGGAASSTTAPQQNNAGSCSLNTTACSVSFKDDILNPMFADNGRLGCAKAGCHGGASGFSPSIDVATPLDTYTNLSSYTGGSGLKYIVPCATDPNDSDIVGNLTASATNGSHMPQDNPSLPDAADLDTITTWVRCGAPFN